MHLPLILTHAPQNKYSRGCMCIAACDSFSHHATEKNNPASTWKWAWPSWLCACLAVSLMAYGCFAAGSSGPLQLSPSRETLKTLEASLHLLMSGSKKEAEVCDWLPSLSPEPRSCGAHEHTVLQSCNESNLQQSHYRAFGCLSYTVNTK